MANESIIDAAEIASKVTAAFQEMRDAIKNNTVELDRLNKSYNVPSEYLTTIEKISKAMKEMAKAEQSMAAASLASIKAKEAEARALEKSINAQRKAQQEAEKQRLAELRLQRDREKAFDKYERDLQKKAAADKKAADKAIKDKEKERLAEIQLQKQREKAFDDFEKANAPYAKLSQEHIRLRTEAKNLAAELKSLARDGITSGQAFDELSAKYDEARNKANQLDKELKDIDGDLGQHGRNVGNYSSQWNGLGNSINQISRELPAFAVNMNTGFLAISNNIPALADEINRLRAENVQLAESGEEPVSILEQLTDATFSWQTALSLGVTALTVYGAEILDFATNTEKAQKRMDLLADATERYQDVLVETALSTEKQLTDLERWLAISQDATKSTEERRAAAKKLIDQYPGYLKAMTEEEIMVSTGIGNTKKYNAAIGALTRDLKLRNEEESKTGASRETLKIAAEIDQEVAIRRRANEEARIARELYGEESKYAEQVAKSLREQIKARKELTDEDAAYIEKFGKIGIANTGSETAIGLYVESQIVELELKSQRLREVYQEQQKKNNEVFVKTSLLDFRPEEDKGQDAEIAVAEDVQARLYQLNRDRLENEANINKLIVDDEEKNYDLREQAASRYHELRRQIADLDLNESKRVLKKETEDEIKELNDRANKGEVTRKSANARIKSLREKLIVDELIAYEKYAEDLREIDRSVEESLEGVYDRITTQQRENIINEDQLNSIRELNKELANLGVDSDYSRFKELEERKTDILRNANEERLQNSLETVNAQIEALKKENDIAATEDERKYINEELTKLTAEQLQLESQLADVQTERLKEANALSLELKRTTDSYINSISSGFLSDAGLDSLNQFFQRGEDGLTEFEKRFKGAGDNLAKQFAVTFAAISSVAQQAFAFMNQASENAFANEQAQLDRRRETALKFAGDNQSAQDEINRQYEKKEREMKRRQLKAQKDQAIFNAVINTAQGVTAAYAQANLPLALLIGVLGAAQIAFISGQQIPAYAEGGITEKNGKILVNDAPRTNYKEVIQTPSGKIYKPQKRNTILSVPKGSRVFKSVSEYENEQLNSVLSDAGIAPHAGDLSRVRGNGYVGSNNGISEAVLQSVMDNAIGKIANTQTFVVNADASGFHSYFQSKNGRTEVLNNAIHIRGKKFGN